MLAPRVDNRPYFLPLLLGTVVLAWVVLFAWGQSPYSEYLSHEELGQANLGLTARGLLVAVAFVSGWTLMTFAMMLPTSLPLINMFARMVGQRRNSRRLVALLVLGYLGAWALFGLAAHTGDRFIHAAVDRSQWLDDRSWLIAAVTFLVAGVYQFTPLKYHCLDKCRSPFSFINSHWSGLSERREAFLLGVNHGVFCVGCCWSIMLLMFAFGVGNLGWMLLLGGVMAVEKNASWGRSLSAPLGVELLAIGLLMVAWNPGLA